MKVCVSFVLVFLFVWKIVSIYGTYRRNTEILNIGWIWSVPYDIGNTLRAPLGGPLSIILTSGLALVMFFGLIVSPVYYLLGTPSRKYHMHDAIQTYPNVHTISRSFTDSPFDLSNFNLTETISNLYRDSFGEDLFTFQNEREEESQSNIMDSYFLFIHENDENCKKLLICHSHGFLTYIPSYFLPIYKFFSKKINWMPKEYQDAVQIGFEDQGNCPKIFGNCTKDLQSIIQQTFLGSIIPQIIF